MTTLAPSGPGRASLPAPPRYGQASVAEVMESAAAALGVSGAVNALGLPEAQRVVIVLVDGLGLEQLRARQGYAATLRQAEEMAVLDAAFPTTTAASLASLGTGAPVGAHGLTGYDSYSPHLQVPVNMLGRWDARIDPRQWQPLPTVLERAAQAGVEVVTVSRKKFRDSSLTAAALRGGRFVGADTPQARVRAAVENLRAGKRSLMYFYWDDLDKTGHHNGWQSRAWDEELEELDAALRRLVAAIPKNTTVLLTADHGMVDVPGPGRLDVSAVPGLLNHAATTFGEPRCLQLRLRPSGSAQQRGQMQDETIAAWRGEYGHDIHIATRKQLIDGGWFGPPTAIREDVIGRIGDVVVLPTTGDLAFHDIGRIGRHTVDMVGQHGALTGAELRVPLLRLS